MKKPYKVEAWEYDSDRKWPIAEYRLQREAIARAADAASMFEEFARKYRIDVNDRVMFGIRKDAMK